MKKIVPFKKEINFRTNLAEITSISLEHTLKVEQDNNITGEFIISGDYRISDNSVTTEAFNFNLPFDITLDSRYILDKVVVDIDDFYYEVINNNILAVNIEVGIDKLEEKPLTEVVEEEIEEPVLVGESRNNIDDLLNDLIDNKEETKHPVIIEEEVVPVSKERNLFDSFDESSETFSTYKVLIVREGDTVEGILEKHTLSKEELEKYNSLDNLKIGDKIIIPSTTNAGN